MSPGRGAAGPGRRPAREAKIRLCPTPGGWSGETTSRGAGGVRWAAAVAAAAAAAAAGEGEAATARPGREGSTDRGGGWVPGRRLCKDKVQGTVPGWARAWELDQGRARAALAVAPSHSPQGRPHLCAHCSNRQQRRGWGTKHRSSCPPLQSCPSSPPPLALSPRPSELAGRWRGREGPRGSQSPLP